MSFVIRRRRPFTLIGAVLLGLLGGSAGVWWLVNPEREHLEEAAGKLRSERELLARSNQALERERDELARRVAVLERARQVDSRAYARVDDELSALHDELLSMKEELAFYKGIVGDSKGGGSVRIQRFLVEPEGDKREYRYRLVLTRGMRGDKVSSGVVRLAVDGELDGKRQRRSLGELAPYPEPPLEYRFKHFQRLEGRLQLPAGFVPKRVLVEVDAEDVGARALREAYPWPSTSTAAQRF